MPGIDLTTALARLLSDARLRREYTLDATALAHRLDVDASHLEGFLGLDRDGLEIQAETLVAKRFHEVASMLPETIARYGEAARQKFFDFADSTWPTGHRRHLEDAVAFCRYLKRQGDPGPSERECNRLYFMWQNRKFALHFVRRFPYGARNRPALQLLTRGRDGRTQQNVIFLL